MSINVTINGNPISVRRGKMGAIDADKEFDRRRKIRLQQVRQQSKEIAEDVRNRVRKEKNKQFTKLDKNTEKDFKKAQEKKLSALQKQYQDCLEEFGNAYKEAEKIPDCDEIIRKVANISRQHAELRGKSACEKLREEKREQDKESKKHIEEKTRARKVENLRSKLVTSLQNNKNKRSPFKTKRKKKFVADIKINGVSQILSDDSDDNYDSEIVNLSVLEETLNSCTKSTCSNLTLDSEGNSSCSQDYSKTNQSKENDIDSLCATQSELCQEEVLPKESRLNYTKICFKDTEENIPEKKSCTNEGYQDSYRSHRAIPRKNDKNGEMPYVQRQVHSYCQPCNGELDGKVSIDTRMYKSSFMPNQLNTYVGDYKEKDQQTSSNDFKTNKLLVPERLKQCLNEYDEEEEESNYLNKSYSGCFNYDIRNGNSKDDDVIREYREESQSCIDMEGLNLYLGKYNVCDESNCTAIRSSTTRPKPEIKSLKSSKSNNKRRNSKLKNNVFRKTIRSIKSPISLKDESEVVVNIHDYDISEDGFRKLSPGPICRKKSPSKLKSPSSKLKSPSSKSKYATNTPAKLCSCSTSSSLPFVPTTIVRPESPDAQDSTVRYYDHSNRFSKESRQPTLVQKISKQSIEVCPPSDDEIQFRERMTRRDEEAKKRGIRALEKNKIRRDYQQLMEELPVLQRQERLASMGTHNPAHHMSEVRCQDLERKKQNHLENLYENYEIKSKSFDIPLITIKSIRKTPPDTQMKQPFKTLDVSDNNTPVLNVGHWQSIESTATSAQASPEENTTDTSECKEQALANLLRRVNKQREILINEAANLPSLQSLKKVLNEEELLNLLCKCPDSPKTSQNRILVEAATSPLITKESSAVKKPKKVTPKPCSKSGSKRNATTSSSDTSVDISHQKSKKGKSRKRSKILIREEGTQTSPLVSKSVQNVQNRPQGKVREEGTQTSLCCPNADSVLCLCSKKTCQKVPQDVTDQRPSTSKSEAICGKVCEIIINTRDDSNVEIRRQPPPRILTEKPTVRSRVSDLKIDSPKKSNVLIKTKEKQEGRDVIPKNMLEMSTSTSYMSPPTAASKRSDIKSSSWQQPSQRPSNKELLQPQRQQTNIDHLVREENGSKELNPRLVKYITKLLNMSRQSIDQLTVSSVSDVSTPTDSIIFTGDNVAREKLQSVMDHFNLSVDDLKKYYLSSSTFSTSDISLEKEQLQQSPVEKVHHQLSDSDQYKDRSKVMKATSPKHFTSVSTSTDVDATISKVPKSTKSTYTTSSLENDIYGSNKYERCICPSTSTGDQKSQLKSPKKSSPSHLRETKTPLKSSTVVETSTASDGHQIIIDRSDSPKSKISPSKTADKGIIGVYEKVCECKRKPHSSVSYTINKKKIYPSFYGASTSTEQEENVPRSPKKTTEKPCYSLSGQRSVSPKSGTTKTVSRKQVKSAPCSPKRDQLKISPSETDSLFNEDAVWRNPTKFLQFVRESLGMSVEEFSELGFQDMFARHMELTEYCHDRIKSLMTLIEKVRSDKREIFSPSPVDPESLTLTSYLELPKSKCISKPRTADNVEFNENTEKNIQQEISASSTSSSISQGTLDDYLLEVEKKETARRKEKNKRVTYQDEVATAINEGISCSKDVQETFVPMLQGIPKYCEAESAIQATTKNMSQILQHIKPKPPPSLLRANMRGHTDATPHELSTIVEAETIVSSRNTSLHPTQSPGEKSRSRDVSPNRQHISVSRVEYSGDEPKSTSNIQTQTLEVKFKSPTDSIKSLITSESGDYITITPERPICSDKDPKANKKGSKPTSPTNLNTSSSSLHKSSVSGVRPLSESTTESPDELESMLRKFKLEWAIALVRKTEKALALSSSSSASDIIQSRAKQDNSDVSLRETYQQIYHKIASSSGSDIEKSQIFSDLSQHFREFHDISEIAGVAESRSKSQQRTSTPVQHSKSTESKNSVSKDSLFKGDSELSSVRNSSDDHMFLSIPNITLNTTKCSLNKSKK